LLIDREKKARMEAFAAGWTREAKKAANAAYRDLEAYIHSLPKPITSWYVVLDPKTGEKMWKPRIPKKRKPKKPGRGTPPRNENSGP
jgi:hypothetical protein